MFTLKSSTTRTVTRELAQEWESMTPSPTERPFSERRFEELQHRYEDKLFIPCQWAFVWLGGSKLRMNGQHSSKLLCKLPEPFPTGLMAHIDEFEAETPEDMAELFQQFDPRASSRSSGDVSGAWQHTYPELKDIPPAIAKLGIEGIAWYVRIITGLPSGKGDKRYTLFKQRVYDDFLLWLSKLLTIKTPELKTVEVIAAMYATDEVNETLSRPFWEEVARGGQQFEDQHPTTVLDKWLKACKDRTCQDKMKQAYHYQGCIFAWNAYREGQKIKEIRFNTSKGLYIPHD